MTFYVSKGTADGLEWLTADPMHELARLLAAAACAALILVARGIARTILVFTSPVAWPALIRANSSSSTATLAASSSCGCVEAAAAVVGVAAACLAAEAAGCVKSSRRCR